MEKIIINIFMKAILEFNLHDPDDVINYRHAINASSMHSILWDIDMEFRKYLKYNDKISQDQHDILQQMRDYFWERMNHHHINLD